MEAPPRLWREAAHLAHGNEGKERPHVPSLDHFVVGLERRNALERGTREFQASIIGDPAGEREHAHTAMPVQE